MFKKTLSLFLAIALTATCASTVFAADLMEDSSFYLKQTGSTCTLTSATMMLRRRAYLDGNAEWSSISVSAVSSVAWSNGLSWNFTYSGMNVQYGTLSSAGNTDELIALLAAHPEGIVVYDRTSPHAVLLTDYTDGVFYCADPAVAAGNGRIPFSGCTISMSNVTCYWYVASNSNTQTIPVDTAQVEALTEAAADDATEASEVAEIEEEAEPELTEAEIAQLYIDSVNATLDNMPVTELSFFGMFAPENLYVGSKFNLGGTLKTPEGTTLTEVTIKIIDAEGNVVQQATDTLEEGTTEWAFRSLNTDILFGQLATGDYAFSVVAKNSQGITLCYARTFTVSSDATVTAYYWTATDENLAA